MLYFARYIWQDRMEVKTETIAHSPQPAASENGSDSERGENTLSVPSAVNTSQFRSR